MEIVIQTKYSEGDVVYGYYEGSFHKFRVDYIKVTLNSCYHNSKEIRYRCTAIVPKGCEFIFCEEYEEQELFTKEEIATMLEKVQNE